MAISKPPEVCGSNRMARYSSGTSSGKTHTIANEIAVILQSAWNHAIANRLERAREQRESVMANFEGNRRDAIAGIAQRHFSSMAKKAEAGHVGNCMN